MLPLGNNYVLERSSVLIDPTKEINLGTEETPHITHVVISLSDDKAQVFSDILHEWPINFTWSYVNIPSLDPKLVVHHLVTDPKAKLVKQKLQKMHPRITLLVKAELEKLLEFKFIQPIDYSKWT